MAAINQVGNTLTGLTGTGAFVGANTPTLITPNIGVATATSLVFNPTTNGIIGTTTNDSAVAGSVGEVISSQVSAGAGSALTSTVVADVTSISLTAGDWDVWGNIGFTPAVGTTLTRIDGWISTTSATFPPFPNNGALTSMQLAFTVSTGPCLPVGQLRLSLSGTTTVYLTIYSEFAVSTATSYGAIFARRRR